MIRLHRAVLAGELGTAELEARLHAGSDQGTTQGSLFVPQEFDRLPALPVL